MVINFVCTGNTCRSPMASALYYKHLKEKGIHYVQCEDSGLGAYEGDPVSANAVEACKEMDVDISRHTTHRLRGADIVKSNFFVVMEPVHREVLIEAGVNSNQIHLLGGPNGIKDPYGADIETFRTVRDQIMAGFEELDEIIFTKAKEAWAK